MNRRREEENTSYRKPGPSAERIAATVQLQTPDGYRDPASLVGRDVCPHCKRGTAVFLVSCDGHTFETHRCTDHGDVKPMRSHIVNREFPPCA